jgi:hypothetical protein
MAETRQDQRSSSGTMCIWALVVGAACSPSQNLNVLLSVMTVTIQTLATTEIISDRHEQSMVLGGLIKGSWGDKFLYLSMLLIYSTRLIGN